MRAAFGFASLLVCLGGSRPSFADDWWGKDKALHFGFSAGIASAGYGATALVSDNRVVRIVGGTVLGLTAGVAKEVLDFAYGDPSWKDLTWDVIGTVVGVLAAYTVDRALAPRSRAVTATRVGFAFTF